MQQRNTASRKIYIWFWALAEKLRGPCNCATPLSTNFFWSSLNPSLHATAQHCFEKINMSEIEPKQKSWEGACNCATLLSTNFFWSSLNPSLHATAQQCFKKIYVRNWALAEKLSRWMQLRNTAFWKFFLKQDDYLYSMQQRNTTLKKNMSEIELKQKSWEGACNCATLLSTNFFWSSLNPSLHATAQQGLKKNMSDFEP